MSPFLIGPNYPPPPPPLSTSRNRNSLLKGINFARSLSGHCNTIEIQEDFMQKHQLIRNKFALNYICTFIGPLLN